MTGKSGGNPLKGAEGLQDREHLHPRKDGESLKGDAVKEDIMEM